MSKEDILCAAAKLSSAADKSMSNLAASLAGHKVIVDYNLKGSEIIFVVSQDVYDKLKELPAHPGEHQ